LHIHSINNSEFKKDKNKIPTLSAKDIQGNWKIFKVDNAVAEEKLQLEADDYFDQLQIRNDSIWTFEYPNQYYGCFKIDSVVNSIRDPDDFNNQLRFSYSMSMFKLKNDTLIVKRRMGGYGYYKRDTFDIKIIEQLKKDSINPKILIGTWDLITKYPDEIEYGPDIIIQFPFRATAVLNFNQKNIIPPTVTGRHLLIPANGVKKDFYILHFTNNRLTIVTGKWCKEPFTIEYELRE
jgi:hypothetical protein